MGSLDHEELRNNAGRVSASFKISSQRKAIIQQVTVMLLLLGQAVAAIAIAIMQRIRTPPFNGLSGIFSTLLRPLVSHENINAIVLRAESGSAYTHDAH